MKLRDEVISDVLEAAKKKLLYKEPFMASLVAVVPIEITENAGIPTAGTDGLRIFVNKKFLRKLAENSDNTSEFLEKTAFILAHEYTHILLSHQERWQDFKRLHQDTTAMAFNVAADAEINERLGRDGFFVLNDAVTEEALKDLKLLDYSDNVFDYSTEQLTEKIKQKAKQHLKKLKQAASSTLSNDLTESNSSQDSNNQQSNAVNEAKQQAQKSSKSNGGEGDKKDEKENGGDKQEDKEQLTGGNEIELDNTNVAKNLAKQVDHARRLAQQAARVAGRGSTLAEMIIEAGKKRRDWRKELRAFLQKTRDKEEESWRKIHRKKFFTQGIVLPSRTEKKGFEEIIILIDTSGSVSEQELRDTLADILDIFKAYKPKLRIIQHTTVVTDVIVVKSKDELKHFRIRETGGTDSSEAYKRVFKYLQQKRTVKLVIHFTDRYMSNNKEYEKVGTLLKQRKGAVIVVDTEENTLFVNKEKPFRGW